MGNYSITTFEKRQIIMAHRPTIKALTRGLGKKVFGRWWNVSLSNSSKAYVEYFHNGENRRIFGFKGFRRVYSLISEENNQLTAYFYKNELNAESKKGLIKIAVLSKSKVSDNGLKNIWVPLEKPEVIFSRKKMQIQKMTIKNIKEFLTADMPEGTVFEIAPRRVDLRGRITFGIDSAKEGIITFYGYSEYAGKRLPGEIIVEGNGEKKCFFWPNYKAIDEKSGPIIPEGHVIAQRKGDGTWKILWQSISELEKRKNATRKYGNYIFASVGDKIHSEYWPVQVKNMDGKKWRGIFLKIRGRSLKNMVPRDIDIIKRVLEVTREIEGRIKLAEFYTSKEAYERGGAPFSARFITFKPNNGDPWKYFNAKLEDIDKFRMLIEKGLITHKELDKLLCNDYLVDRYNGAVLKLVDDLGLYELI